MVMMAMPVVAIVIITPWFVVAEIPVAWGRTVFVTLVNPLNRCGTIIDRWLGAIMNRCRAAVIIVPGGNGNTGCAAQQSADNGGIAPAQGRADGCARRAANGASHQGIAIPAVSVRLAAQCQHQHGNQSDGFHDLPPWCEHGANCRTGKLNAG